MATINCENCGAPKIFEHYANLFRCEHCGTTHFPTATAFGEVEMLDARSALSCPLRHGSLHHARADRWAVLQCATCAGLFTDGATFWQIVKYRRARNTSEPTDPRPLDPADLRRKIACPQCTDAMVAHHYYGPGRFVIDSCRKCRGVWLDRGEISEAVDAHWTGQSEP